MNEAKWPGVNEAPRPGVNEAPSPGVNEAPKPGSGWQIRPLEPDDMEGVISIDELHSGERKPHYWERVFGEQLSPDSRVIRVGLAAEEGDSLIGYLTGEVRAFEFGSEACGWILAVGVDPTHAREKVASSLLAAACRRFHEAGVTTVRTMVQRSDVPLLSFFRANGFVGGSFAQLELSLPE